MTHNEREYEGKSDKELKKRKNEPEEKLKKKP
jgi:hypothetical protein